MDPTIDPTADPTVDPTTDPTDDPTADPTVDPTTEPTTEPTKDPTVDPTEDPTVDPTADPTADPTSDPTTEPTTEPTVDPTVDPTSDPTTEPTRDPTVDPTSDPSADPTYDPTNDPTGDPTTDPTLDPTSDPTVEPTMEPSYDPTAIPTDDPTAAPSLSPTAAPTASPLSLAQILEENAKSAGTLNDAADYMLYLIFGGGIMVVIAAILVMKWRKKKEGKMAVDDQGYISALIYMVQIVDIFSDFVFALQCRAYRDYGEDDEYGVDHRVFNVLWTLALTFFLAPYLLNLASSINITRKIAADPSISQFTKQYFQDKSKFYTLCVLLSGGSFRALKFMNSNLFGLPLLSAGLSNVQLQGFQSHHVLTTVLAENIPQIVLQYFFLFELNLVTTIVIVSFASSLFNILLCIMTSAVFYIMHRNEAETPFTILVSWTPTGSPSAAGVWRKESVQPKGGLDPYNQCGRRNALGELLSEITLGNGETFKFEILASRKVDSGCLLFGTMVSSQDVANQGTFSEFMGKEAQISDAVISAFELDPVYCTKFDFKVTVSETTQTTRADKVQLAMDTLRDLDASPELMSLVRELNGDMVKYFSCILSVPF